MSIAPVQSPSKALGVWALVCAILAPVWLFGGLYSVLGSMRDDAPAALVVFANVAAFGWFIVPVAVIGALVLGILAIVTKRGKRFGVAALIVLLVAAALIVLFVAVSFGLFQQ
jgi:hypothetical protein